MSVIKDFDIDGRFYAHNIYKYNLYYYGGFLAPNCLMTFVTHDTRDLPPLKKKVLRQFGW